MSTGLGGDCFILYKPAGDAQVYALNGSGRAAASLTTDQVRRDCAATYGIEDPDSISEFPGDRTASVNYGRCKRPFSLDCVLTCHVRYVPGRWR